MIIVLGIHGYARSGKDTLADAFADNYGFTKVSFADPLKEVLIDMDPLLMIENAEHVYLSDVVGTLGWDEAKTLYPDIRQMLVRLGQGMRNRVYSRIWVNSLIARAEGRERIVVPDVRQLNEAQALHEYYGAELIHLTRPEIGPVNEQEENVLPPDMFKYKVSNHGDVTDLRASADMIMSRIMLQRGVSV